MTNQVNRRTFVGGAVATGAIAGLSLASTSRAAAASDKIVVGVMGLSRGRALAQLFAEREGVEVKYVCDVDQTRASSAVELLSGRNFKRPTAVGDVRRVLDDRDVDVLVCAAPNHWHAPATILACQAGKHVYVEKPCCHNPQEGEWMVAAARKYNRAVQMGAQRRSGDGIQAAMQALHEGVIGRVYLARSWYYNLRPGLGIGKPTAVPTHLDYDLWQGPAPRTEYLDNRVHYNWHWFWQWGNGELGNNGVHTLDLCRWGLDVDYPIRVTSSGGRYAYQDDQETPDTHSVAFEFEGRKSITWEGLSCNKHGGGFAVFYGDAGALELDQAGNYTVFDRNNKQVGEPHRARSRGDVEHVQNLLDAIRNDTPRKLNAEIEEGYKSTMLCLLGNIAHRTGRALTCDPANGHIQGDPLAAGLWKREYEKGWEEQLAVKG